MIQETPEETRQRLDMVDQQLRSRGIRDERVLRIMAQLPRQHFIPPANRYEAYQDQPVSIGFGQTISQPYIVALMTEKLMVGPNHEVFEIGTGSGYQTAILTQLARHVYTMEYLEPLARQGQRNVEALGCVNVTFHHGDGCQGWPENRQFDRILVAAAGLRIPPGVLAQLRIGGKMVIPVGPADNQQLLLLEKQDKGIQEKLLCYCRFVKLVGAED